LPPRPLAWLVVSACAPEQPYFGPKDADDSTGYTNEKLDQIRYRVTYSGSSATNRETVENFLLWRAAQVTQQAGSNNAQSIIQRLGPTAVPPPPPTH
jgi:hypothetical protein